MTTITSNKNEFSGKVHSNSASMQDKYEYNNQSGCAGYMLLASLIAVAAIIVWFIVTHS